MEGLVYIIKGGSLYKIGRTTNLERRLRAFNGLPFPVEVVHTIQAGDACGLETSLHSLFKSKRVKGEWFSLTEEDLDTLKTSSAEGLLILAQTANRRHQQERAQERESKRKEERATERQRKWLVVFTWYLIMQEQIGRVRHSARHVPRLKEIAAGVGISPTTLYNIVNNNVAPLNLNVVSAIIEYMRGCGFDMVQSDFMVPVPPPDERRRRGQ
jgi:hypothetical protein